MTRREHLAGLLLGLALVAGGRALAYAATPTPLAARLGGPRLPVIVFVALALGALVSLGVLWLAALGVRERHALEPSPGAPPRLPLARLAADAAVLGNGSLAGFAAVETWVHSRAGMHMPWWACLEGPVHRNAIPILVGLSLVAAALLAAARHALAWARRVVAVLRLLLAAPPRARRAGLLAPGPRLPARGCSCARCACAARPCSPSRSSPREESTTMRRTPACRASARAGVLVAALALAPSAFAHAELFPNRPLRRRVTAASSPCPNEKDNASTTEIQLTIPSGFDLESVAPSRAGPRASAARRS